MSDQRRVVVTGATGLIGRALCKKLRERGYAVVVFSRSPDKARQAVLVQPNMSRGRLLRQEAGHKSLYTAAS